MAVGIEKTKEVILAVKDAVEVAMKASEDGKIDWRDLKLAPALVADVRVLVSSASEVKEELKDLDADELRELLSMLIDVGLGLAGKL